MSIFAVVIVAKHREHELYHFKYLLSAQLSGIAAAITTIHL